MNADVVLVTGEADSIVAVILIIHWFFFRRVHSSQ